ncbi:hypothetical protein BC826DRAFT_229643 [Russula brevipes]|nr:hypothetical protein BC826DRAFT_229643 [Russula brevipes]
MTVGITVLGNTLLQYKNPPMQKVAEILHSSSLASSSTFKLRTTTNGFYHRQPRYRCRPSCPRPCRGTPRVAAGKVGRQAPAERDTQGDRRHHADHARAYGQDHIRASSPPCFSFISSSLPPSPPFSSSFLFFKNCPTSPFTYAYNQRAFTVHLLIMHNVIMHKSNNA